MKEKKATQVTGCKQCQKGLSKSQKVLVAFSFYLLGSAVYGTIKLIQILLTFF